ncbi:MAG TPA: LPS assembly lipoprotein LptE [Rhizomicrobium sp.]
MRRLLSVIAVSLLAAACGFHPLYGGMNADMQARLSTIYVEPVEDRIGYELRNRMIDLLDGPGTPGGAAYRLKLALTQTTQGVALQTDTTITRYNDTLKVTYTLTDANGKIVTQGLETGLSSYNVLPSGPLPSGIGQRSNANYGTLAAQQDADKRAAEDIAERIRLDLNVFFAKK